MTVRELKAYFQHEISEQYSPSEITVLFVIFCKNILNKDQIEIKLNLSDLIDDSAKDEFLERLSDLKTGKPYQQIFGEADFYGMKFFVDENVLIPRPETEELLELAIEKIQNLKHKVQSFQDNRNLKILDIGTGSGVIPIVLKKHFPDAEISSVDFSEKALKVARKNASLHKTETNFIHADYLEWEPAEKYDVIISNPPYIARDEVTEIENIVKGFEPEMALLSPTSDALIFYKKIAHDGKKILNDDGMIFLEINQRLGQKTLDLFQNFSESELHKDISGNDRMIFVRK